jgi:hypothetical protein
MYGVQDGLHFFLPFRSFNQEVGESFGKDLIVLTMNYLLSWPFLNDPTQILETIFNYEKRVRLGLADN